ncbi:transcriptional regulator [Ensifer adhaerens]|nr:helix-turn-helix domain-containing protein [Ensifer adhaerens]MDF8357632.1 helix-turn-helix domain-containing protein [Ensifer adhaerens]THA60242.1 transcriptional regulator [Ensifer adhaerens]
MLPEHNDSLLELCRPVRRILARVGDKWSVMIVMALKGGPRRFNDIKRAIGTISQRMLTLTLKSMERDGSVKRTVYPTKPPRVDYELTALGHSLREPVERLSLWAIEHEAAITKAQSRFDALDPQG